MSWLTERLSQLLLERGQNVEGLARQLGIERSRLSKILSGSAVPNENLLKRLARHFDEPPDNWLLHAGQAERAPAAINLPGDFFKVAALSELPNRAMKIVFNNLVVVANAEGKLHAFGNVCPHAAGPIGEGFLDGCVVECPWHNGQWDITTGEALTPLATADIPVFAVRVIGDDIEIKLTEAVLAQKADGIDGPGRS